MKRAPTTGWSEEEVKAGQEMSRAWQEFFAAQARQGEDTTPGAPGLADQAALAEARTRHEAEILAYPNVVGVASGIKTKGGQPTGTACIVVYVSRKLPRSRLKKAELIPASLDGIPVDVVEIGQPRPLSP